MDQYLTRDQVRALDRRAALEYGLPTLVLMELAGRGAAATLISLGIHGPVVVVCGKGNNGGDGLVIARRLHNCEIDVRVLLLARPEELSADARANWRVVSRARIPAEVCAEYDEASFCAELGRAEWAVDALFGIGLQGPVRPPWDRVLSAMNSSPAAIFAVDIPSGLDADTGEPLGVAIRARHTATLVAPKKGYANPVATPWLGKVHVVDLGVPARLIAELFSGEPQATAVAWGSPLNDQ
jgi:NAD(P)H-hydrate epimerase